DPGKNIDNISDDRYKIFTPSNSVLQSNIINAIATDQDGSVWIGTNNGVVVVECGEGVFDAACTISKRVVVQQDLGGNLLDKTDVQCIAIDGANRKWFGTRSGIQVLSSAGDQLVYQYTIENSPLFDNLITALEYKAETGEMFIGTGSGVQSIRTDATAGSKNNQYGDIYAFPNPVRPEYTGPITIQGMRKNTHIKITDFNGLIVYEGKSNGGTFVWNGLNLNGNRVASGIYIAWMAAGDGFAGADTRTVKIAVVR
ncbi:MAG: two-component regulator propeller domain-containing protein, partial [Saprospiraceae bacterium]